MNRWRYKVQTALSLWGIGILKEIPDVLLLQCMVGVHLAVKTLE